MRKIISILAMVTMFAGLSTAAPAGPDAKKMGKIVDDGLDFSLKQSMLMYETVKGMDGQLPNTTKGGELVCCKSGNWVAGFFPGTLWYLYENTGDADVLSAAEVMTSRMEKEQYNTDSHDVGFMMNCSYGNAYRLTGREDYRQILVNSANSLATRFCPAVGCTRSWKPRPKQGWDFIVIIDNMMNLELLTMSASLTGDLTNYNLAKTHANTTMKNHFRPDYSSFHVVNYDEATGKINGKQTAQGLADDSSWARGQGWGLYGFTMMYRQTGDAAYLEQAINIGKYIMNHPNMPKDKVPYWDFCAPASKATPRDASAAALMASAYIELSQYVEDEELSKKFLGLAEQMLISLSSKNYRAKLGSNANYVLQHCTAHKPKDLYDTALVYADYYYVEALMRYKRLLQGRPVVDVRTAYSENPDRNLWLSTLDHVCRPVLANLSVGNLKKNMPVEGLKGKSREYCSHLEALGRVVVGIAPWLELGPDNTPEGRLRAEYIDLTAKAIAQGVDPEGPDYMTFDRGGQPLVDAAFLMHGMLRAPTQIWGNLTPKAKTDLLAALKLTRGRKASETNHLFFASMVEAGILEFYGKDEYDWERLDKAIMRFRDEWYKGDGWYGDGASFHFDYYNSFVIQPMMVQILDIYKKHGLDDKNFYDLALSRMVRYGCILERMISPEGTYPAIGRSITYRFGCFQALEDICLRHVLPAEIDPAAVRCGISAVIRRQMSAPGTFDKNGWLTVGFCGDQVHMSETYISTGSQYLVTEGLLTLGLPASDPFWSNPDAPWSGKQAWSGVDINADHFIKY